MPLPLAWLLFPEPAAPLRMEVRFAGSPVGESSFEGRADGSFRSRTRFTLGAVAVDTTIEGRFQGGKVVRYTARGHQGATEIRLDYTPGRLASIVAGKKVERSYTLPANLGGNLHPQFFGPLLFGLREGETRKTTVYLTDLGAEIPISIESLPVRTVRVDGHDETVRRFEAVMGAAEIEYDLNPKGDVVAMDVPGQRLRFLARGWEGLFDDAGTNHPELSQPTYAVERIANLRMRTRDGTTLVADVVRPRGRGRFPAILERTPYGRETALSLADYWAARGYVYVAQDCRGRGDSGGDWDPFVNEGKDGFDAIAWVARQSWCDGNVGTIGASYAGVDQWQAAVERPPALRCIVPEVSPPDAMRNLPYEYGTFFLSGALWWSRIVAAKKADLTDVGRPLPNPLGLQKLPLDAVDRAVLGEPNAIYQSWLRRTTLGDWRGFDHEDRLAQANVPALHVSGWFDGDGIGTKLNWEAMRRAGRKDQWLVYGPWTHAFNTTTRLGDVDFGAASRFDLDGLTLRFFDTFLKGRSVGLESVPRAQVFVTGANRWISLDGWPATTTPLETRYLAPGALEANPGGMDAAIYTYDPAKDKPHREHAQDPGRVALPPKGAFALFKDRPVSKPTAIAGPFEVRLFFKSGAKDTDFFATLLDVAPNGSMRAIGIPGKLRASYRDSLESPTLLKPGRFYTALIRPWDAAHELAKGHRLGLLVTSSMFPAYARNLGTGEPLATGKRMVAQRNAILTGTITPSRITYRRLW